MSNSGDKESERSEAGKAPPSKADPSRPTGLVSVDAEIDEIARKALETAKRTEEADRLRRKLHPVEPK
jgi:tRNA(Ser,Leu) C12 N-acetylase TAN1